MFGAYDPEGETRVTAGNLPHWYQPGATYFVTFRTADSIPAGVAASWRRRRDDWLRSRGIDPRSPDWSSAVDALPHAVRLEFRRTFARAFMEHLDRGHGECVLGRPELARIVGRALLHADGERYRLGDFVVMPNHVHLLVGLLGGTDLLLLCRSWKQFAATRINRALGRRGRFWQEESFDHLVRGPEEFERLRRYIAANPAKANLRDGKSLYHRRPDPPAS